MGNKTQKFTSELVDEQIDWLLARRSPPSPDGHLVDDLRQMYQDDERSLSNVWQRLGLEESLSTRGEQWQETSREMSPAQQPPASTEVLDLERNHPMRQSRKHALARILSLVAAACVVAVIVGSMLWISSLARQGKISNSRTAARGTTQQQLPQGVYTSSNDGLFRFDSQMRQTFWQLPLKDIANIVPAGNIVYILQSSQFAGGTNAVVALDANTGKTLWAHAFALQKHGNDTMYAQTTNLVLSQGRLYIGWQSWDLTTRTSVAQIYVLNASNGRQFTVYPATAAVGPLAVGDGVLAVSADSSLQVYNPASGKPLWHVSMKAPTNLPVISLSIVNDLIFAVITTSNETVGAGQSYIAAYKVSTGERVWQSPRFVGDALSHFTVDQNMVYFGTLYAHTQTTSWTGSVYAYDIQSNKQLWSWPVKGGVQSAPVVNNGVVYVEADNGVQGQARMLALTAATGAIKWQQSLAKGFADRFCVSNGIVYAVNVSYMKVPAPDGVYALNANNGSKLWEQTRLGSPPQFLPQPAPSMNIVPTE